MSEMLVVKSQKSVSVDVSDLFYWFCCDRFLAALNSGDGAVCFGQGCLVEFSGFVNSVFGSLFADGLNVVTGQFDSGDNVDGANGLEVSICGECLVDSEALKQKILVVNYNLLANVVSGFGRVDSVSVSADSLEVLKRISDTLALHFGE